MLFILNNCEYFFVLQVDVSGIFLKDVKSLEQTQIDDKQGSTARVLYCCLSCQKCFPSEADFHAHNSVCKHPSLSYMCSHCFLCSHDKLMLQQHADTSHNGRFMLQQHIDTKHNAQTYVRHLTCKFCSANFKSSTGLKKHIQVKHGTQSSSSSPTLKCPICDKIMYNKINLDGHINQHNGVKPHICTFCGKGFSYKQSLQAHAKLCTYVSKLPDKCEM